MTEQLYFNPDPQQRADSRGVSDPMTLFVQNKLATEGHPWPGLAKHLKELKDQGVIPPVAPINNDPTAPNAPLAASAPTLIADLNKLNNYGQSGGEQSFFKPNRFGGNVVPPGGFVGGQTGALGQEQLYFDPARTSGQQSVASSNPKQLFKRRVNEQYPDWKWGEPIPPEFKPPSNFAHGGLVPKFGIGGLINKFKLGAPKGSGGGSMLKKIFDELAKQGVLPKAYGGQKQIKQTTGALNSILASVGNLAGVTPGKTNKKGKGGFALMPRSGTNFIKRGKGGGRRRARGRYPYPWMPQKQPDLAIHPYAPQTKFNQPGLYGWRGKGALSNAYR